jgi:biopolymer transport protein ExbB
MGLLQFWEQSDAIARLVVVLMVLMSVLSWVLIFWKSWLLPRALREIQSGAAQFWSATDVAQALTQLSSTGVRLWVVPLVEAAQRPAAQGSLGAQGDAANQLTRHLRGALTQVLSHLQHGQVLLASIGSTAPFIGLFGTVWGIYHALVGIAAEGQMSIDKIAGPVGEALIMTAAGLAVAIPAVLAYNIFGRMISRCEVELEGFAHDLRQWQLNAA